MIAFQKVLLVVALAKVLCFSRALFSQPWTRRFKCMPGWTLAVMQCDIPSEFLFTNMPDRNMFGQFFKAMQNKDDNKLSLEAFIKHDDIKTLLEHGSISLNSVRKIWAQSPRRGDSLSEGVAYDALCKILQLSNHEEFDYLEREYQYLCRKSTDNLLTYNSFLNWEEISNFIGDDLATESDIQKIWISVCGSLKKKIDLDQFLLLNKELSLLFERNAVHYDNEMAMFNGELSSSLLEKKAQLLSSASTLNNFQLNGQNSGEIFASDGLEDTYDINDVDVWDTDYRPEDSLEPSFIAYLRQFYNENNDGEGLSFDRFRRWDDLLEILRDEKVDESCLDDLWKEALFQRSACRASGKLDFDTFLRLNIRLDMLLSDVSTVSSAVAQDDFEAYYTKQFDILSYGRNLLTYDQLMQWEDLQGMFEEEEVSEVQVRSLWKKLPKEIVRTSVVEGNTVMGGEAITLKSFFSFCTALLQLTSYDDDSD